MAIINPSQNHQEKIQQHALVKKLLKLRWMRAEDEARQVEEILRNTVRDHSVLQEQLYTD